MHTTARAVVAKRIFALVYEKQQAIQFHCILLQIDWLTFVQQQQQKLRAAFSSSSSSLPSYMWRDSSHIIGLHRRLRVRVHSKACVRIGRFQAQRTRTHTHAKLPAALLCFGSNKNIADRKILWNKSWVLSLSSLTASTTKRIEWFNST